MPTRSVRALARALALSIPLAGGHAAAEAPLRLAYTDWSSSVASANLVCAVLRERLRVPCELRATSPEGMWRAVAEGSADAMLSAWLPTTHGHYLERYGDRVDDLGPNLEGTRTGLVVPAVSVGRQTGGLGMRTRPYVTAEAITDLRDLREPFGGRIVGIDPGAGVMRDTRRAMEVYGLEGFRLVQGSERTMTEALAGAIRRQEWIVVTGWTPHWMFGRWSLRFLADPEGVYGGEGRIHTLARQGLEQDMPGVYRVLDRFHWRPEDMDQLLVWIEQAGGLDPYAQAARWLRSRPGAVGDWLP
jgi:glycine betaine/proline transport system substrate-binding protein